MVSCVVWLQGFYGFDKCAVIVDFDDSGGKRCAGIEERFRDKFCVLDGFRADRGFVVSDLVFHVLGGLCQTAEAVSTPSLESHQWRFCP